MYEHTPDQPSEDPDAALPSELFLVPDQTTAAHDELAECPKELFLDYARMSDRHAMDCFRYRLAAFGPEGDNAIDLIGELRSNFVQNVSGEERHVIVSRLPSGVMRLYYIGFGHIQDETYSLVETKLTSPSLVDLMDESGRGYFMMSVLSSSRGIQRLCTNAGENIGVELWFDVNKE